MFSRPITYYVLVPATLGLVYAFLAVQLLPRGINRGYAATLSLAFSLVLILALVAQLFDRRATLSTPAATSVGKTDFFLILVPMSPVVQYLLLNRDILLLSDVLILVPACLVFCLAFGVLVPRLLQRIGSSGVCVVVAVSLLFSFFNMPALSKMFSWHVSGDALVQLGVLFAAFVICGFLYRNDQQVLRWACVGLFVLSAMQGLFAGSGETPAEEAPAELVTTPVERAPNIYVLTYDSYVSNETMLQYGIDNGDQEAWLLEQGFVLYPTTYSVAASTLGTMGRLFGGGGAPRTALSGGGPFFAIVQSGRF